MCYNPHMDKQTPTLVRKHVFLEQAQVDELEAISAQNGASVAWLVRDAVRQYLAQRKLVDAVVVWRAEEREP